MALLKKIKSATLVEALIATILILIVFMISSLVINNLLLNNFSKNTHQVEFRLNELQYALRNKKIKLPYHEEYNGWEIDIQRNDSQEANAIALTATNKNKEILKKRITVEK